MTTYNTGNPIGSTDPRDLYDNAENLDELVNSQDKAEHPDRLGVPRKTWHGMEEEFDGDQARRENEHDADQTRRESEFQADQTDRAQRWNLLLANSGYEYLADYAAGIEVTEYNQVLRDTAGQLWRASASTALPYTTDGTGLPEGGAFIAIGDADIRNDLSNEPANGQGALLVRGAVIERESVRELLELDFANIGTGTVFATSGYMPGDGYGATYRWDAASTAPANEIDCIAPDGPGQPGRLLRVDPVPSKTPGRSFAESVATQEARSCSFQRGYWWGEFSGQVRRSVDGIAWEDYCTAPPLSGGPAKSFIFTEDGEVLAGRGQSVYKSTGFFSNPSSVTWTEVFNWGNIPEKDANSGGIIVWSLSGYGRKAIVTHYSSAWPGRGWNRVACITTDNGETWQVAYDGHALHGSETEGHPHGVEYDRWADAFYFIEGHASAAGVYYSYDDGTNWHRIETDFTLGNGPTSITATKNGIVLCSDTSDARGIYVIRRPTDRENVDEMQVSFAYELRHPDLVGGTEGIYGFGSTDLLDPRTGIVYTGWADSNSNFPCITASDGDNHGLVYISYDQPSGTNSRATPLYITNNNELVIRVQDGDGQSGTYIKKVRLEYGSSFNDYGMDAGRIWGGNARVLGGANNNNSVAVGPESVASSRLATAVGQGAVAGNGTIARSLPVAVGYHSEASGNRSVAVGGNASSSGNSSVVIGGNASDSGGSYSVVVGDGAQFKGTIDGVVIGDDATADFNSAIAIGAGSKAEASNGIALGKTAVSSHPGSVAIGRDTETSLPSQVHIGERHLALDVLSALPGAQLGHDCGVIYFASKGGRIVLEVMFPNGARKEIVDDQ